MADFDRIKETVFKGKVGGIPDFVRGALDEGISPQEIIDQGLIFGMNEGYRDSTKELRGEAFEERANVIFKPGRCNRSGRCKK
jgi:methanogenic corrinoid protein MtbC1